MKRQNKKSVTFCPFFLHSMRAIHSENLKLYFFMHEYQFFAVFAVLSKKQKKTRLSKKCWHVRQLPRRNTTRRQKTKTKRVSFNPSTDLAFSPAKRTLATRNPRFVYTAPLKKIGRLFLKVSHRENRGPFSRTTRQWSMVSYWNTTFLSVRKIVATQTFIYLTKLMSKCPCFLFG